MEGWREVLSVVGRETAKESLRDLLAKLGLSEQRYPYRPRSDNRAVVERAVELTLRRVRSRVQSAAAALAHHYQLNDADAEDLEALVMRDLWTSALYGYDATKGTPETWLNVCVRNRVRTHAKRLNRERQRFGQLDSWMDALVWEPQRPNPLADVLLDVVGAPDRALTQEEGQVLEALIRWPNATQFEIADRLGYRGRWRVNRAICGIRRTLNDLLNREMDR